MAVSDSELWPMLIKYYCLDGSTAICGLPMLNETDL